MFTGLITEVGVVRDVRRTRRGLRLTIGASYDGVTIGESIAVDGVCLTVVARRRGAFDVEAIGTTQGRTKVSGYRAGTAVNLERALTLGGRLGGHLVAGHVDGVGRVVRRAEAGDTLLLDIAVPPQVRQTCVPRGSIAVDGVSLTINALRNGKRHRGTEARTHRKAAQGLVQIALIPHTIATTTLGTLAAGDKVHLEADLVGKFVMQLLEPYRAAPRRRER